jgi:hypothetical protein
MEIRMNITEDGRTQLTFDEAVALLPDGDDIHTFLDSPIGLIGADWRRQQILDLFCEGQPELSGERATAMRHGLVVQRDADDGGPVFIATKREV